MEPTPGPERVSRRLREQFAPAYLAITGLVQVLVLDALITKVEGDYAGYGATEMTCCTLARPSLPWPRPAWPGWWRSSPARCRCGTRSCAMPGAGEGGRAA